MKRIRLNSTNSVNSVNIDNNIDVELKQTSKPYFFTDLKGEIDQHEVFENERKNCNKYRLITTINPFCTNVLFNPLTEIIKNEGSSDCKRVWDNDGKPFSFDAKEKSKIIGKVDNVNRSHMIMNTEYSKDEIGYDYKPGYDMFNNHILRNISFKLVNKIENTSNENRNIFNTIEDTMRDLDGKVITFNKRKSINSIDRDKDCHLYLADDILNFTDSINANLTEENGWFGFINNSSVLTKKREKPNDSQWEDMNICRVLNNRDSCEFIDMYPDRTLFSFNPKYNKYRHREEYNWHICLTYPYANEYNHPLVKEKGINSLHIENVRYGNGINGAKVLMFNTLIRNGVKKDDIIKLNYSDKDSNEWKSITFKVTNVGNNDNNYTDHYFYTTDLNLLNELINEDEFSIDEANNILMNYKFRFNRIVNGYESEYYIRKFRKLPNFKNKKEELTDEIARDVDEFTDYIEKNCYEEGQMLEYDKEQYQLAFASTIYNDNSTQITFTDGIDVEHLVDNRNRPLSEIYVTIIKNNKGNTEWYNEKNIDDENIEYSHCFGPVSCGFEFLHQDLKITESYEDKLKELGNLSDVSVLNECNYLGSDCNNFGWNLINDINIGVNKDDKITINDELFIGDIVEYNPIECVENVLENAQYRFNTVQRENLNGCIEESNFLIQEIISDDYDDKNFEVQPKNPSDDVYKLSHEDLRPEGYYYKPHYKILLKELGIRTQSSNYELSFRHSETKRIGDDIFVEITTNRPHKVSSGDIVLICDDERQKVFPVRVCYTKSDKIFYIKSFGSLTCSNLCDILNGKYEKITFIIRRKNNGIPFYADNFDVNKYIWRDIRNVGDKNNVTLEEYPFINGYFYVNQTINFYLKRQDPFGIIGLYYYGDGKLPNDVAGKPQKESNYVYKDESYIIC